MLYEVITATVGLQAAGAVESLRGSSVDSSGQAPGNYVVEKDHAPAAREFVQQPPLIPHKIDGYTISTNFNKCMDCHSWTRYREAGVITSYSIHYTKLYEL